MSLDYRLRALVESWRGAPDVTEWGCSHLTEELLHSLYRDRWDSQATGDLRLFADRLPAHPDAPILAAERLGWGERVTDFHPGRWHLVQVWWLSNQGVDIGGEAPHAGHAFLVYRAEDHIQIVQTAVGKPLKTSVSDKLRGPWERYAYCYVAVLS